MLHDGIRQVLKVDRFYCSAALIDHAKRVSMWMLSWCIILKILFWLCALFGIFFM